MDLEKCRDTKDQPKLSGGVNTTIAVRWWVCVEALKSEVSILIRSEGLCPKDQYVLS